MSKRKNFKDLFGCDDSDEENVQTDNSGTSAIEKLKNKSERAPIINDKSKSKYTFHNTYDIVKYNGIQKNDCSRLENDKKTVKKEGNVEKELNIAEQNIKRIKTKHGDNNVPKILNKVATDSEDVKNEISGLTFTKYHQNDDGKKKVKLKKTEIGGLVVKLLTPAYVEKRFESRETFKMLARNISHALYDKDEQEIKEYIKNFLNKHEEFTSHTTL